MSLPFETPWTVAHQTPLSTGYSRQDYWSGLPFPSPGHLPKPGIESRSPALAGGFFTIDSLEKPQIFIRYHIIFSCGHTRQHVGPYFPDKNMGVGIFPTQGSKPRPPLSHPGSTKPFYKSNQKVDQVFRGEGTSDLQCTLQFFTK